MLLSTLDTLKALCGYDAKPSICFIEPMASGAVSTGFSELGSPAHLNAVPCPAQILSHWSFVIG